MKNNLYILVTSILLSFTGSSQSNGFEVIRSLELMDQIYEQLDKYYVDDVKAGSLSKTAIDAMLKELDPYTVYYHESNIEDYQMMTTGQYGGIGALIRKKGDFVYIAEPYEGEPAQTSGLKAGDKILSIDGVTMEKKNSSEVSSALKGPKGTSIEIKVERNKTVIETITVTRGEIKLPDVPFSGLLKNDAGYIKLNSFTRTASSEVKKSLLQLKKDGAKSIILDLRGNGGGLLIEAVNIVNLFVPKNQIVVTTKGRVIEENRTYRTKQEPVDLDIPVIVLVNEGSASASEIVSGSLQDLDRAVIVGTRSYGKGLVQRTYELDYGSKMKLTIAKYYTPSGRCVQRLEYYDKLDSDSAEEIPDSLITIFKTTNGRDVIDGRGVEPDATVKQRELSRLTFTLLRNNFIFDYATEFFYSHATIATSNKFEITDKMYDNFKAYILRQDFTYSTASEEMLKRMKKTAEEEGFYDDLSNEYESLMSKVTPSKERDLEKFKTQITLILENEIISRYYYQNGRAIQSFKDDVFIDKSMEILQDKSKYNTILGN